VDLPGRSLESLELGAFDAVEADRQDEPVHLSIETVGPGKKSVDDPSVELAAAREFCSDREVGGNLGGGCTANDGGGCLIAIVQARQFGPLRLEPLDVCTLVIGWLAHPPHLPSIAHRLATEAVTLRQTAQDADKQMATPVILSMQTFP
jgi:hypothetical protein